MNHFDSQSVLLTNMSGARQKNVRKNTTNKVVSNKNNMSVPAASTSEHDQSSQDESRPLSTIWKGIQQNYNYEEFQNNVKKKGLVKDDLTLESHRSICNLIIQSGNATALELAKSFSKVEERIETLKTNIDQGVKSAEETALKLFYEKERNANCIVINNCTEKDAAKELLEFITEETMDEINSWTLGLNKQHTAVRLDENVYKKVFQKKGIRLKGKDKFSAYSIRPLLGPIEMNINRRLWETVEELNNQDEPEYNGNKYNINEGRFRVLNGSIRFVRNRK